MLKKIFFLLLTLLFPLNNVLAEDDGIAVEYHGLWEGAVPGIDIIVGKNKDSTMKFSAQYYLRIIDESHAEVLYKLREDSVFQYKALKTSSFGNPSSGIVVDSNDTQVTFGSMTLFFSEKYFDSLKVEIYGG